ncbi:MAG: DUF1513 domain-containing protein [Rubrivivax sp.]
MTHRRHALARIARAGFATATAALGTLAAPVRAEVTSSGNEQTLRIATTWRGPGDQDPYEVGVFQVDLARGSLRRLWSRALPARAHGLQALPDGGLLVAAARPGRWLMRVGADGSQPALRWLDDEPDAHRSDGHLLVDPSGHRLWTPQTDRRGQGWIALRDPLTLALRARWPAHGVDPHQLLLDEDGHLLLALGGIRRTPDGHKVDLERMKSALVKLHHDSGALLGRWTLSDPRLSLRHLAWSTPGVGQPRRLGIALQAEHDDPAQRAGAPLLAWWDGDSLHTALDGAPLAGYAGDIGAAPDGGFVLSAQSAGRAVHWTAGPSVQDASAAQTVARLRQACALAAAPDGALWITAPAGLARWHPDQPPRLLRWPGPLLPDNHALLLG